jgi:hypothetical protein
MKWRVEYENDVGPSDEGFWQWWTVTNDDKSFECKNQTDAQWLCDVLNMRELQQATDRSAQISHRGPLPRHCPHKQG